MLNGRQSKPASNPRGSERKVLRQTEHGRCHPIYRNALSQLLIKIRHSHKICYTMGTVLAIGTAAMPMPRKSHRNADGRLCLHRLVVSFSYAQNSVINCDCCYVFGLRRNSQCAWHPVAAAQSASRPESTDRPANSSAGATLSIHSPLLTHAKHHRW